MIDVSIRLLDAGDIGVVSLGRQIWWGETVVVDDDLALYSTKRLRP